MQAKYDEGSIDLLASGHKACAGCGAALTIQAILRATGAKVFVANATGCMEIIFVAISQSAWKVPWIHSLFENTAAVASGIEVALKALGRSEEGKVVVIAGDGGLSILACRLSPECSREVTTSAMFATTMKPI